MNRGQIIIALLLVANLCATVWFGLSNKPAEVISHEEIASQVRVDEATKQRFFEQFKKAFNQQDYNAIYNMLGPLAKSSVEQSKIKDEFKKLIRYFKRIESGAFTHSEFLRVKGDSQAITLNYRVRLSQESEFGQKGHLKISVLAREGHVEIYGIRLTGG